jgi:predicted AlkP superfamily phosphohydrolase/phosphomutase
VKTQVVVIGLDSMELSVARELIAADRMPNLGAFLDAAAWSEIANDPSVVVGSVWPTLTTGCDPGRHGFHGDLQIEPGTYEARRRTPAHITTPPVWDAVSAAGLHCAVLDVPVVAASKSINGVQLVEWCAHSHFVGLSSTPETFAAEVVDRFGANPVQPKCDAYGARGDVAELLEGLRRSVAMKEQLALEYLTREEWDLYWVVFGESHCAGHQLWRLGDGLIEIYELLDAALGRLLAQVPDSATVLVVLSHGFGPRNAGDHLLSEILRRLDIADDGPHRVRTLRERALRRLTRRARDARRAKPLMSERRYFRIPNNEYSSAIRVNVKGREPRGLVAPGAEYEAVLNGLRDDLLAIEHPDTGTRIVEEVRFTDDSYDGPMRAHLPDAFVIWNPADPITGARSPKIGIVRGLTHSTRIGDHRAPGLVAFRARGTAPGRFADSVAPVDVAPTIASLLGVELTEVEGAPIEALVPSERSAPASP